METINWGELTHLFWAFLGWLAFMVDQWGTAKKTKGDQFNWGIFISSNLPVFVWNLIAMIVVAGINISSGIEMSVAESFACGFGAGYVIRNRLKGNNGNK